MNSKVTKMQWPETVYDSLYTVLGLLFDKRIRDYQIDSCHLSLLILQKYFHRFNISSQILTWIYSPFKIMFCSHKKVWTLFLGTKICISNISFQQFQPAQTKRNSNLRGFSLENFVYTVTAFFPRS